MPTEPDDVTHDDHPTKASGPGRAATITLRITAGCCLLFAVADLVLHSWDLHDLWTGYRPKGSEVLFAILIAVFGTWLLSRTNKPRGPMTTPILLVAAVVCGLLGLQAFTSRSVTLDESIVQQGRYPDICPGRTVAEMLEEDQPDVRWASYLNIYGHRSVSAAAIGAAETPVFVLIWTIDRDDRFWVQYAEQDGMVVDPYVLLQSLCGMPSPGTTSPETPAPETPANLEP